MSHSGGVCVEFMLDCINCHSFHRAEDVWLNLINSGDAVIARDNQGKRLTIMQTLWTAMQIPSQIIFKIIFDIYVRSHSIMPWRLFKSISYFVLADKK